MLAKTEELRRRISVFRRYLDAGTDEELSAEYRRQITEDETELHEIEAVPRP